MSILRFATAVPPLSECALSWRQLYESGAFFQHELRPDGYLKKEGQLRGLPRGLLDRKDFEQWDEHGVLLPVGFAKTAYVSGMTTPAVPSAEFAFREEQAAYQLWERHAWDAYGHAEVSPLYTPWQLLPLADAVEVGRAKVPLPVMLRQPRHRTYFDGVRLLLREPARESWERFRTLVRTPGRDKWAESLRWFYEEQNRQWTHLHAWWEPTLKVLVRLQNRYYPRVRGTANLLGDETGRWFDPEDDREFAPQ